ncbi:MAG: NAD(P)-dependent oxidoreductase [Myxococcales bacterium]
MRVLVTGGSGFLGSHVVEQLAKAGHTVRALVRRSSNRTFLSTLAGVEFAEGSVEDAASLVSAMRGVDGVVHAAGLVKARNRDEFFATNVTGTTNLLDATKREAPGLRRFVFVSSLGAVGPSADGGPVDPGQAKPVTHYGRSKLEAERAVVAERDRLPVTVIRPPLIYGPRDTETLQFFQWVARGVRLVYGDGSNTLSLVYGADAASACVRALEADVPSGSAYFVDDGEVYPWRDVMIGMEEALGKRTFVRFGIPLGVVKAYAALSEAYGKVANKAVMVTRDKFNELSQRHWVCSSLDTREALGWSPKVKLAEGLSSTASWYRQERWLS